MTQYPMVRLDAPGLEGLNIDPDELGLIGQTLDLGDAVTRTVVQDAPNADGTIDTTSHAGARNVTLRLIVSPETGGLWALEQRLRAFTRPDLPVTMTLTQEPGAPEQQITLRRSQWTGVIGGSRRAMGSNTDTARDVTVQWVAPFGILESSHAYLARAAASGGAIVGRTYPYPGTGGRTYPRVYPVAAPSGQAVVINEGTTYAYPIIRVYGPIGNGTDEVEVQNRTTGQTIVLVGLVLAAGEFVELDTRAQTILFLGSPLDRRTNLWQFRRSDWWRLAPGSNDIRYVPDTYSAPAEATIEYRHAWL